MERIVLKQTCLNVNIETTDLPDSVDEVEALSNDQDKTPYEP